MGTSIAGYLSPAEVAELEAIRSRLLPESSGVATKKFLFFAAFDGTNNDKNNLQLSGQPYQTNVANLYDQAKVNESENFRTAYYAGVGTGGTNGNWINAGVLPTSAVRRAAEVALEEFARRASDYLVATPTATYADLSVAATGFSRGTGTAVMFAKLLHERGLVLPDGTVVAPPGSIPITGMVLFDPVHTFIQEDLSLPPNVVGQVLVFAAKDELRSEFRLADYRHDPRVRVVEIAGNHSGIGGSYDLHGTGAVSLEGATAFLQNSDVPLANVPPERRFDPSRPVPRYTEVHQVARNGDLLTDEQGRPLPAWRELPSRGMAPLRSSVHAPHDAGRGPGREPFPAYDGDTGLSRQRDVPIPIRQRHSAISVPALDDPRDPHHRLHALYDSLKSAIPDAPESRLVQFTAACHLKGITAENMGKIRMLEKAEQVWFERTWPPGPFAKVDLNAPMPTPQQSMQQVQAFDQQQAIQQTEYQAQRAQVERQRRLVMGGPMP
ncbi:DUF2235 domain-containing protein [Variovorax sp. J22R24]|uniref:phospholipase effector Tle1 domain-containing protein n=1 Tax=Variovorax gracilis TaxID=3053502 RepID=UPI0025771970|nr:DUF2235 domain-containing protein [Variovorax sp. J22R24]MDM0105287.1 DUF2235 domain-containing protein [Variovorax sp. J22R24]